MEKLISVVLILAVVMSLLIMSVFTWAIVKPTLFDSKVLDALRQVVVENRRALGALSTDLGILKQQAIPQVQEENSRGSKKR